MTAQDRLTAGRAALAEGAWELARAAFEAALEQAESAGAWEGLAWAAWWLEDGDRAIAARELAHRRFLDSGDRRGVARTAIWLGNDQRQEAASSPLARPVASLAARDRDALVAELEDALADYIDDDGVVLPLEIWIVTARR